MFDKKKMSVFQIIPNVYEMLRMEAYAKKKSRKLLKENRKLFETEKREIEEKFQKEKGLNQHGYFLQR